VICASAATRPPPPQNIGVDTALVHALGRGLSITLITLIRLSWARGESNARGLAADNPQNPKKALSNSAPAAAHFAHATEPAPASPPAAAPGEREVGSEGGGSAAGPESSADEAAG
jgi:hypothetical protein